MRLTKPTHGHSEPAPQIGFGVTRHFENTVDWAVGCNRLRDGGRERHPCRRHPSLYGRRTHVDRNGHVHRTSSGLQLHRDRSRHFLPIISHSRAGDRLTRVSKAMDASCLLTVQNRPPMPKPSFRFREPLFPATGQLNLEDSGEQDGGAGDRAQDGGKAEGVNN